MAYLCGATDQWSIDPTYPRNPYIPKQMSFIDLTNSCAINFKQSITWAVGRFSMIRGFRYVLLDFSCQFTISFRKYRQNWPVTKQMGKEWSE